MKIYKVTMDTGTEVSVNARCASDAIQDALMQIPGHKVTACRLGDSSGMIHYDVPKHSALTVEQVDKINPKKEPREHRTHVSQRPAPWIEEWQKKMAARQSP